MRSRKRWKRQRRHGLVLGAGGVLGAAWMVGALRALEEAWGWDPRTADVIVGTSAGSVLAALLGAGIGTVSMVNHQRGTVDLDDPPLEYDHDGATGGPMPPRPRRVGIGSKGLFVRSARRRNAMGAMYGLLPEGRRSLWTIGSVIDTVSPGSWAGHPNCWVVAVDYDEGDRVVFGRPEAPPTVLANAVMASCAIPGWFAPVQIDGRRYVDGGVHSVTSLDLLAGQDLDEVTVLAPMASFAYDSPRSLWSRLERTVRRVTTRRVLSEADAVRDGGTAVNLLAPGAEDLTAFGGNVMDPARRAHVLETSLRTSAAALADSRREVLRG
ncbi:MAG: patatin-like phospholipase family protein [Streptosporangiales bacterium]|nr:patatin-like phospholipase family protein [Streptosporangiales bacterium]